MTPEEARQEIARELSVDEHLLWSGVPRQGIQLRPSDAFLIPFSLLWGGFALFWETSVLATHAPWFFKLWGIPFVVMGIYLVFGRFLVDSMQRERIAYGLTSTRAIIVSGLMARSVKSLQLRALADVTLTERPDQSGTITLGTPSPYAMGYGRSWPGARLTPAFEMIEDAKRVYARIREAQQAA
jgi:hypothetical protein